MQSLNGEYVFIGDNSGVVGNNGIASAQIQWNTGSALKQFQVWLEVSSSGCSNFVFTNVSPQPNNHTIGFTGTSGSACFSKSDNSFTINFITKDNQGQPLSAAHFPLEVELSVNNQNYRQTVTTSQQELQINDALLSAVSTENTAVEVVLNSAVEANNAPLQIGANNKYIHTIYAIPGIQFESNQADTVPLNTFHSFEASFQPGYTCSWWFEDASGNKTYFTSESNSTENYFWDTEGHYTLFVQATDENGCVSEIISKPFTVKEQAGFVPSLVALPDINVGYENSLITGNVATNDFDFLDQELNLVYSIIGEPALGLTFFDDGSYEYQPPQGYTGKIHFTYKVCFEGLAEGCATADVEIRVLPNISAGNIMPVASTDAALSLPNQTVFSNLLVNDIDPDGFGAPLTVTIQPVKNPSNGTVSIESDGNYAYTPNPGFTGIDRFLYRICDNGQPSLCDSAWVYVIVSEFGGNGKKPVSASDDMFLYVKDTRYSLRENDSGDLGENLVYTTTPVVDVTHGTLQLYADGTFTYTADEGYLGVDWFVYNVCNTDNEPDCRQGTGFILITSGMHFISLAGNDTVIGSCSPYRLSAQELGDEFSYSWQPAELLDDPTIAAPLFTPGNSTLFKLTVTNDYGFSTKDSVQVTVSQTIADAGEDIFMYRNEQAVLDGSKSLGTGIQYHWTTTNGKIENGANTANPVISEFGTYLLEITDAFGCTDSDSVKVGMLTHVPVAADDYDTTGYRTTVKINVLENDTDPDNDIDPLSLTIKIPPYNGTASVDYNDFTINYRPKNGFSGTDNFEYQVCDTSKNCDVASVYVLVSDFRFFIPDAFSPNGDGINDYFEIVGIEMYEGNSIEIFNRWGNRVYRADNYGISSTPVFWDGKPNTGVRLGNEELPSGTYFYVLDLGNGEKRIVGSVYLDR